MVGCLRIADLILCGGIGILGGFHGCVLVVGTENGECFMGLDRMVDLWC
jgi:hypothetical protein